MEGSKFYVCFDSIPSFEIDCNVCSKAFSHVTLLCLSLRSLSIFVWYQHDVGRCCLLFVMGCWCWGLSSAHRLYCARHTSLILPLTRASSTLPFSLPHLQCFHAHICSMLICDGCVIALFVRLALLCFEPLMLILRVLLCSFPHLLCISHTYDWAPSPCLGPSCCSYHTHIYTLSSLSICV